MIAFVSQLPLMMQPCFAVNLLEDFRINIKKWEIEKAMATDKNGKSASYVLWQF